MPEDHIYTQRVNELITECHGNILAYFEQGVNNQMMGHDPVAKAGTCFAYSMHFISTEGDYSDFLKDVKTREGAAQILDFQKKAIKQANKIWDMVPGNSYENDLFFRAFYDMGHVYLKTSQQDNCFISSEKASEIIGFTRQHPYGGMYLLQVRAPGDSHAIAFRVKSAQVIFFEPNFFIASFPALYTEEILERYMTAAYYDANYFHISKYTF